MQNNNSSNLIFKLWISYFRKEKIDFLVSVFPAVKNRLFEAVFIVSFFSTIVCALALYFEPNISS